MVLFSGRMLLLLLFVVDDPAEKLNIIQKKLYGHEWRMKSFWFLSNDYPFSTNCKTGGVA